MKQNFHSCGFLFLLLIISSQTSARFLATKQGEKVVSNINSEGSLVEMEGSNSFNKLMGLEDCENGDEECLMRRVVAEVHLDYIYTQHHKP